MIITAQYVCRTEMYRTLINEFPAKDDPTELRINFEQFCALASESSWTRTKNNGVSCESEIPSIWNILSRKASNFLRRAIVHPFNRFLGISDFQQFPLLLALALTPLSHFFRPKLPLSHLQSWLFYLFYLFRRIGRKYNSHQIICKRRFFFF